MDPQPWPWPPKSMRVSIWLAKAASSGRFRAAQHKTVLIVFVGENDYRFVIDSTFNKFCVKTPMRYGECWFCPASLMPMIYACN